MMDFDVDFVTLRTVEMMVGQWAVAVGVLRSKVAEARLKPGVYFIPVKVNLPDGLEFQFTTSNAKQVTQEKQRVCTYNMSVNNIYPDPASIQIEGKQIKFSENYTRTYEVSHFLGIMIAEQLRFSTLRDSVNNPKYEIDKVPRQWKDLFHFFFDNFKLQIYNSWKQSGNGPVSAKMLNGNTVIVQILIPFRAGP